MPSLLHCLKLIPAHCLWKYWHSYCRICSPVVLHFFLLFFSSFFFFSPSPLPTWSIKSINPKNLFICTVAMLLSFRDHGEKFTFDLIQPVTQTVLLEEKLSVVICSHISNNLEYIRRVSYTHIQSNVPQKCFYMCGFINFTPSVTCFSVRFWLTSLSLVSVLEHSLLVLYTKWTDQKTLHKLAVSKLLSALFSSLVLHN